MPLPSHLVDRFHPVLAILLTVFLGLSVASPASAEVIHAVNCGGSSVSADDGTVFLPDTYYTGGVSDALTGTIYGSGAPEIHASYRSSTTSFAYELAVANGDYVIDLYFADDQGLGARQFNVSAEGSAVLTNYDIRANVPLRTEVIESIPVTVTDGALNLVLSAGSAGEVKLSALRLRTVPAAGVVLPSLSFDNKVLIDEIDCGDISGTHAFIEYPAGATQIATILGDSMRVMPNPVGGDVRYFAYRIGAGAGLEARKTYLLEVDYPEDLPRTTYIINAGANTVRGFHTGETIGDGLNPPYLSSNPESLDIPLSGEIETWQNFFHLHDRFTGIERQRSEGPYPDLPEDGFLVVFAMMAEHSAPLSNGIAVSAIRLYEVPQGTNYAMALNLPPDGLSRRHLFYREEMADGVIHSYDSTLRGIENTQDWFRYKAERMEFLGMNTFTINLLEFGANQGFDSGPGGGNSWYYRARDPERWDGILDMISSDYDFDVLPYYEYAGSLGGGEESLGAQKRALPLGGLTNYTHVSWAEKSRADLADPDTIEDAKLLLDVTMTRYKEEVNFIGAWFRARVSQMPMSFNDLNLSQFAEEANGGIPIVRQQLIDSAALYDQYKDWWFGKRREFINALRDHMREQGIHPEANLLFTSDATESGKARVPSGEESLLAEDVALWSSLGVAATDISTALAGDRHYYGMTTPRTTWSGWEWHHADMENDPYNYTANEGGMLTYSFNRYYTVADADTFESFRTPSGLAAIRHYFLNEDTMTEDFEGPNETELLGYFVSDCEYTGPYSMMEYALAFAHGDPRYLGFLSSLRYNPGFPAYVRAFNQAFLALPAEISTVLSDASSVPEVIVRSIETEGYGTYLGVVNTARNDVSVTIALPERGMLYDAATGEIISSNTDTVTLEMYPFELRALRLDKQTLDGAVAYDDHATLDEGTTATVDVLANDTGPGTLTLASIGQPAHGVASIVNGEIEYTPEVGYYGEDSIAYTVTNGTDDDIARLTLTVSNTAIANDLSSWGLAAYRVGDYVNTGSRILSDGVTGELSGSANGFEGTADSAYYESQSVIGDFTITVHVDDLPNQPEGVVGLMLRQSPISDSRFVALGLDAGGAVRYHSRYAKGGSSTGDSMSSGASWLRLVRTGSLIELQTSTDGSTFTTVGGRVFPGLPVKVEAGLFLTGGDVTHLVRALVSDFSVTNQSLGSDVLFAQDFDDGGSLSTYYSLTPSQHLLSEIVAETEGGTWSIQDGALSIKRAGMNTADSGAGFARLTPFVGQAPVVKFSFDFGVSGSSTNGGLVYLILGDTSSVSDYNSAGSSATKINQLYIKGAGVGLYHFPIGSEKYGETAANGTMSSIVVYVNNSGTVQTYEGPDGGLYTLDHYKSSIWLNDEVLYENLEPPSTYAASDIETFIFRVVSADTADMRFDNIVAQNRFVADTVSLVNTAPQANDDSVAVDEGSELVIDPLGNDSDADNAPLGLHITGYTSPLNGSLTQVNNTLRYTPNVGYYGPDSFDYTVSDGADTATATVNITVNDISVAHDLSSFGLTGTGVGGSTGYSRVFPSGLGEMNASGGTLNEVADSVWYEHADLSGNFTLYLRLADVVAKGGAPRAGLMIREGLGEYSRMAYLCGDDQGFCRYGYRDGIGSSAVESVSSETLVYPAARLRLQRFEDTLTASVSRDGVNYAHVATIILDGLSESLQVGIFTSEARTVFGDFLIEPWQDALFQQDFSSSTDYTDYFDGVSASRNQFTDISAESDGGTWQIVNGALKLTRPGIETANNGAGFSRLFDFEGSPNLLRVSFDVAMENMTGFTDKVRLEFGDWESIDDYNSGGASASYANALTFKGSGTGNFRFRLSGANSGSYAADGTMVSAVWYINNTGSAVSYVGLDGQSYNLDHHASSLWVNGMLLFDNLAREGAYTINEILNFRLRPLNGDPLALALDNLVIEDSFLVNTPPVAVDDAAATDERTQVSIAVLDNDTDSDGQPSSLSVYSYSHGANGAVMQSGNELLYTPDPGFVGTDSFTYLVSDGAQQDWGRVTVTVNSTAQSSDLSSYGLTGSVIGDGSGDGRILNSAEIELAGSGSGLFSTSDGFYFEHDAVSGDFSVVARVKGIWGYGPAPRAGLMIRESTDAGARMVALATTPSSYYTVIARSAADGPASETVTTDSYVYPDAWLMLERVGDIINVAVSSDGTTYVQIDSVTLSGLATTVEAGLFTSSGSATASTVATLDDFDLTISSAIFMQTFDASALVGDYYDASSPSANQFNDISAEADGGTWSINSGELTLVRSGLSTSESGAGFMRYTDLPGSPQVLKVEFDLSVQNINNYMDIAYLRFGDFTQLFDYSNTVPSVDSTFELTIKGGGPGVFRFRLDNTNSSTYLADGTRLHVVWYLNASGATINYIGPDDAAHSIDNLMNSLWVDGVLLFDNVNRNPNYLNTGLADFYFRFTTNQAATIKVDNLAISDSL